jgi:integrase
MDAKTALIGRRTVDAVAKPAKGEARLWDTKLIGFHLRVYSSGRRVYAVRYRAGPALKTFTIGAHGSPWTPNSARKRAQEALDSVRRGEDPAADKSAARHALTVGDLIDRYLEDGPATKSNKRDSSWDADRSCLNRHIRPLLGRKIAGSLTKAEVARAIRDIGACKTATVPAPSPNKRGRTAVRGGEGIARRSRAVAGAMLSWGLEHGLIKGANPFTSVKLVAAPTNERFLSREEAGRLLDALTNLETEQAFNRGFGDSIRLLLLTGARKSEILGIRWSEVDFSRTTLTLAPERTKAGGKTGERRIVLSPAALSILSTRQTAENVRIEKAEHDGRPVSASPYVFPASRGNGHLIGLHKAFQKACAKARLSDIRIHDLRHSYASFAISDGASLFLVAKLLGHSDARTTERYAHLRSDLLQDATDAIGNRLMPQGPASPHRKEG